MDLITSFPWKKSSFGNIVSIFFGSGIDKSVLFWQTNVPNRGWQTLPDGVCPSNLVATNYYSLNATLYSAIGNHYSEVDLKLLSASGNGAGLHLGGHHSPAWDYYGRSHLILDPVAQQIKIGAVIKDQNVMSQVYASASYPLLTNVSYRIRLAWSDTDQKIRAFINDLEILTSPYQVGTGPIWSSGMVVLGDTQARFSNYSIHAIRPTNGDGSSRRFAVQRDSITAGRLWVTNLEREIGERINALGISLDTGANMFTEKRLQLDLACMDVSKIILFHGANDLSIGGNFSGSSPQVDATLAFTSNMAQWCLGRDVMPVLAETIPRSDVIAGLPVGRACNAAYNQKLIVLASGLSVPVIRWYESLLDPASPYGMMPGLHDGGWIHPNPAGARLMVDYVDTGIFGVLPPAPKGLIIQSMGTNSATLSWNASGKWLTGYTIFQGTKRCLSVAANSLTNTVTNLNPGTLYHFRVVAENNAGSSDFSSEVTGTTLGEKTPETIFQKPVLLSKIVQVKDGFLRFKAGTNRPDWKFMTSWGEWSGI